MLLIIVLFMMDTLLDMAGVSLKAMSIEMVGGVGDMDWKGEIAVTTGAATVDSLALGKGGVVSLTLLPFLLGRGVFF